MYAPSFSVSVQEERKSKLADWFDMPKPEVTEEAQADLEVVRMRRALDNQTHVRRSDTKSKFYQVRWRGRCLGVHVGWG